MQSRALGRRPVSRLTHFPAEVFRTMAASSFRSPPIEKATSPIPCETCFPRPPTPLACELAFAGSTREDESLEEFADDSRLRIDAIPAREAKGLGWARSRAQLLYDGEEFNLQIDGHTRFIEGWDEVLIGMLAETDAPKPLLTTYPKGFVPGEPLPPGSPTPLMSPTFAKTAHGTNFPPH